MAQTYVTRQNDMIDAICRSVYGDESGYAERVLDANPGLAEQPPILPAGVTIVLPDLPRPDASREVVALWD